MESQRHTYESPPRSYKMYEDVNFYFLRFFREDKKFLYYFNFLFLFFI